jgi:peptidoglycan/LPS O-acetylase OafA/YrhL
VLPDPSDPPAGARHPRYPELDALRGLAAVTVVFGHVALVWPVFNGDTRGVEGDGLANLLKYTPLSLPVANEAAVVLFFVLSGFVLALPFLSGRGSGHPAFVVKRVLRIYPAYLVATLAAIALASLLPTSPVAGLGAWFNVRWQDPVGLGTVLGHVVLLGDFRDGAFNPVIWSLIHEMRISLVFPLLLVAVLRRGWRTGLALAVGLLLVGAVGGHALAGADGPSGGAPLRTVEYAACFAVGILLAAHVRELVAAARRLPAGARAALWVFALLAYTYSAWFDRAWFGPLRSEAPTLGAMTLGAALVVVLALSGEGAGRILRGAVPQFLGRISYSLYLVHAVVLLAVVHAFHEDVPVGLLVAAAVVLSVGVAAAMHRFVELPAMRAGRRWAARLDGGRAPAPAEPARA